LTISLPIVAYSSGSRMPAGRFWKKLYTRPSTRLTSSCVGDPTELTGDVFSDLGREEAGKETISPEANKTDKQLFDDFNNKIVLESTTYILLGS
jgi:hypothetical protein